MICNTQKGALRAQFTIAGRMSHGAMPLSGLNTAPAIAKLISALHQLEYQAAKHPGRDEHLGWPSFTPTVIQAPAAGAPQLNVMPVEYEIASNQIDQSVEPLAVEHLRRELHVQQRAAGSGMIDAGRRFQDGGRAVNVGALCGGNALAQRGARPATVGRGAGDRAEVDVDRGR